MSRIADYGVRIGQISYGTPNFYIFTVTPVAVTVGATYTNNGYTFTALNALGTNGADVKLYCLGTGAPAASGTLTYSAGGGVNTGNVTFSAQSNVLITNQGAGIYVNHTGYEIQTATQVAAAFSATNGNPPFDVSEPPVGSLFIANAVKGTYNSYTGTATLWQHISAGTAAANWSQIGTGSSGTLATMITDVTATYTEVNALHSSNITAAEAKSAFSTAGKLVHTAFLPATSATPTLLASGVTYLAGVTGVTITPVNFQVIVDGGTTWVAGGATSLIIEDTAASVVIATIPVASLTANDVVGPTVATIGAGFMGALTASAGIQCIAASASTGSNLLIRIDYVI